MGNINTYPDHRFNLQIITLEYDSGQKPEQLLDTLREFGWIENPVVRNPLMEIPGCMQEYSLAMKLDVFNPVVLKYTKHLVKSYGFNFRKFNKKPGVSRH